MLKISAASGLSVLRAGLLAVPICEDDEIHDQPALKAAAARGLALEEFRAEPNQQVMFYDMPDTRVRRCLLLGIGAKAKVTAESLRLFGGRAVKTARRIKAEEVALAVPLAEPLGLEPGAVLKALMEGALLANQNMDLYKGRSETAELKQIVALVPDGAEKSSRDLARNVEAVCAGTLQARTWVNTPSNLKTPAQLAADLAAAGNAGGLKVNVLNDAQLRQKKFGALLAVAAGSVNPPRLVEMVYSPARPTKSIVLVGKGVTFDSGGLNLKPSSGMETMKADMGGAAAVAGAMLAIARLKPKMRVVGLMPLVENMPSGSATRPGDIVTSFSGKTIEIGNTDAEGRLILVDALAYGVKKHKPDILIDLATLTGACVVALGEKMAAVFSADDQLAEALAAAGRATHERCWRMPMPEDYKELLKSDLADISNMPSSRYGGAISAALFLSEFVGGTRWAHIDIAGPAFIKKGSDYCGPGGTGFGVRLLCELLAGL